MNPLATGYEHPGTVPDEVWREYLTPIGETIERARHFERMLTALDPAELEVVAGQPNSPCVQNVRPCACSHQQQRAC